jgi:hypothetical protein
MADMELFIEQDGVPVPEPDPNRWSEWFATADRDVQKTAVPTTAVAVFVSTVFLGMASRSVDGPPLVYETMVFRGLLNGESQRYPTRAEALTGHERMIARVRAAGWPSP